MNIKFYQAIDTIHGTIFYTNLEKKVINTPYFNRLHDVNQSSTVYLTFPPNRTKRYEHSLGVMQLTSDLFCSAAANSAFGASDWDTTQKRNALNCLVNSTGSEFNKIIWHIQHRKPIFFLDTDPDISEILDSLSKKEENTLKKIINENFMEIFQGNCLLNLVPKCLNGGYETFLFMALLQALRMVGLLHDIGHPPQSHILEEVIQEISDELSLEKPHTPRQKEYIKIMSKYNTNFEDKLMQSNDCAAIKSEKKQEAHLHEKIGLYIVKHILKTVFPEIIEQSIIHEDEDETKNIIHVIYYITVGEFVFAILRDKNLFWEGLHSIIDGTIDTDRMDCIPRDSRNSGMTWGQIEYTRIIKTAKFGIIKNETISSTTAGNTNIQNSETLRENENLQICFSAKVVPQMDDLLINRYKIFSMINYHHRSTKVAALYKKAVKLLALHYLESEEKPSTDTRAFSDISGLWRALSIAYSQKTTMLNIIQWNDSWMNGILYKHLIEGHTKSYKTEKLKESFECLKEIFLNENKYFSLIKRKSEVMEINKAAQQKMTSIITDLSNQISILTKELKQPDIDEDTRNKKLTLIDWINVILYAIRNNDWGSLESKLGFQIKNEVADVMNNHIGQIESWFVQKVGFSLGLDKVAYVYDYSGKPVRYSEYTDVASVIKQTRMTFPYFYIYIKNKDNVRFEDCFMADLRKEIGLKLGEAVDKGVRENIDLTLY